MIYISSACVKNEKICDSVEELVQQGFRNIELSGGTKFYEGYVQDLLNLKRKHSLNYLVHNYFPAPKNHFVLNLASLDKDTFDRSYDHVKKAVDLSEKLGGDFIAFHAGFFIHIPLDELGKKIKTSELYDRQLSENQFYETWIELSHYARTKNIKLYLENNVLSSENYKSYNDVNPFMLTDWAWHEKMKQHVDFNLLLDIAHLKVSSNTLHLDFDDELKKLFQATDYIHVSDNDGNTDSNQGISEELFEKMKLLNWRNKTVTLEIYESMDKLKDGYQKIKDLINA